MTRRVVLLVLALLMVFGATLSAQNTDNRALQAYLDRFRDSTPETKLEILKSADASDAQDLGPLYVQAIQFVLTNAAQIADDVRLRDIALFSIEKTGQIEYAAATGPLWTLFTEYDDNSARIDILNVLGTIGKGDAELVLDLNGWVQAQVNLYRGGVVPDGQVLRNAVRALGSIGDASSFPFLLDVQLAQISDPITNEARTAMKALPGDYVQTAIAAINARTVPNRLAALEYFLNDSDLTDQEDAQIATGVLSVAEREVLRDPNQVEEQRRLRYRAVRVLEDVVYPDATNALIRHFNLTFSDYDKGATTKTWVLEAIAALGNTGTEASAQRLTNFLDLLNNYTENDRPYDDQIMLAVITNLGRLGNPGAYDAIFYVTLLDYPQRVKDAARKALDSLTN